MSRLILMFILLFIPHLTQASPFDAFAACEENLTAGDKAAAKVNALQIVQLRNSNPELRELGAACLEGVYGMKWQYNENFNVFVSGSRQTLSKLQNDLKGLGKKETDLLAKTLKYAFEDSFMGELKEALEEVTLRIEATEFELTCAKRKLDDLETEKRDLFTGLLDSNSKLIQEKTIQACKNLNTRDPEAAILNPICRAVFENTFHPDLDVDENFDHKLESIEAKIKSQSRVYKKVFRELSSNQALKIALQLEMTPNSTMTDTINTNLPDCSKFDD